MLCLVADYNRVHILGEKMATLFKLCLVLLMSVVLGESTQGDQEGCHKLEIQLAEQNIKIESLQKDVSEQEASITELMIKVAMQNATISQLLRLSEREDLQTQFHQNVLQLLSVSKSWTKNMNEIDAKIQSAVMTAMQNVSGRYCIQTDILTDEIDERIKSAILSTIQNATRRDCSQPQQNITEIIDDSSQENQGLWLNWGEWSHCSKPSCSGIGFQIRERVCFDSMTDRAVNNCPGTAQENRTCTEGCKDCKDYYDIGIRIDGLYKITPSLGLPFDAYCDMNDGGWIVIQNRFDGSVNFTRGWSDYVNGFGSLHGEYWLGLDKMYKLTNPTRRMIKIDMKTDDNRKLHALYKYFSVGDASSYSLHVSNFINGSISSESFAFNNDSPFSTFDLVGHYCARDRRGGWWYNKCNYLHLNGLYGVNTLTGMNEHFRSTQYLIASRMKLQ